MAVATGLNRIPLCATNSMTSCCDTTVAYKLDIQTALDIARNADTDVSPQITNYLESQVRSVWKRLQKKPDTYILSKDEFALFNFYIYRYRGSEVTEKAVERFWNHHQGSDDDT